MNALKDIRILDLTRMVAGPFCTMALGDLGAEVIKIEEPRTGDDTRQWGPPFINGESAYFISVNRNKKSVTLDLRKEEGQELIRKLVAHCDVLVENFRPGTMDRFNLDYETLRTVRADLVYCSITGYGLTGPDRFKPATDPILQARGGIIDLLGEKGGRSYRIPIPIIDMASGFQAYGSILAALIDRSRSGRGHFIEVSLLETELSLLLNLASSYLIAGEMPERQGSSHPSIVPSGVFEAKDRRVFLSASSDVRWRRLCQALELAGMIDDRRFATAEARVVHRADVDRIIQERLQTKDADEWAEIIERTGGGIPFAPVNGFDRIFTDPQVVERGIVTEAIHPITGRLPMLGIPVRYDGVRDPIALPPPRIGEHTDEVLCRLAGLETADLAAYRAQGII